jgi:hypothetical protein
VVSSIIKGHNLKTLSQQKLDTTDATNPQSYDGGLTSGSDDIAHEHLFLNWLYYAGQHRLGATHG